MTSVPPGTSKPVSQSRRPLPPRQRQRANHRPYGTEYASDERSMIELVFAPCSKEAGGEIDWIGRSDEGTACQTLLVTI
jgi:hypothetical protein